MRSIHFNGVHSEKGTHAFPARPLREFARQIERHPLFRRESPARQAFGGYFADFRDVPIQLTDDIQNGRLLETPGEKELNDLGKVGWGIMFPEEQKEALFDHLGPLLELRRQQAGSHYREIPYKKGQLLHDIMEQPEGDSSKGGPKFVPYYLLIAGEPNNIPFTIQYDFDRRLSVGRLAFDDLEDYGRYAGNVVRHETKTTLQLKTTIFGTRHPDDTPSAVSSEFLGRYLGRRMANSFDPVQYRIDIRLGEDAHKLTMTNLMGGSLTPDLLLTATHGLILPNGATERQRRQGALVCDEWPGPHIWKGKPIPNRMVFTGNDVSPEAEFNGMIAFIYACYGGGTPERSNFPLELHLPRNIESHRPFIAHLPKRMLSAENGCRAVIAHVDTTFIWSFTDDKKREETETYQAFFRHLMEGKRIGFAMNVFQRAHQEQLAYYLELVEAQNEGRLDWEDERLVQAWFMVNDLRNHILLGDPAVTLPAVA